MEKENILLDNNKIKDNLININITEDIIGILDLDLIITKAAGIIFEFEQSEKIDEGIDYIRNLLKGNLSLKLFHKAFLEEKLGDFLLSKGSYREALSEYKNSKLNGNKRVFDKIINIYTSASLLIVDENFTWENNVDFLIGECQNESETNIEALADLGYYTYLYKEDTEKAKEILVDGIKKGSSLCIEKYLDVIKSDFFSKLDSLSNLEKKDFITENKGEIEKYISNLINIGKTEYLADLGDFYEKIGFYYKSIEIYKEHIKVNNDYIYYKNIGDILSSYSGLLYNSEYLSDEIISSYKNLSDLAYMHNDEENYIYGLKKLFKLYIDINDEDLIIETSTRILNFAQKYEDITLEEETLVELYKVNDRNIKNKISKLNNEFKLLKNDLNIQREIIQEKEELNYDHKKIQRKILDNLIDIDKKYLLLEGCFYEKNDMIKALNSYLNAYDEGVYDSGAMLGMFIESLIHNESNTDNKKFLKELSDSIYSYHTISNAEVQLLKDIIKK